MVFKYKKTKNIKETLMHIEYKTEILSIHEAYTFVCGMVLMRSTKFPDMFFRGQTCKGRPANLAPEKCQPCNFIAVTLKVRQINHGVLVPVI